MDRQLEAAGRLPRQPKPIPPGSSATRLPDLMPPRERLDELRRRHLDVAALTFSVDEGRLYQTDFLVTSMVQRSYGVVDALIDAVDSYNIHAAAPLLRLQLDTLFRAHYAARCANADELFKALLRGEEFRKLKDSEGKKLSDGRLKDLAAAAHPWAPDVYDKTSGWVHFSLNHMITTVQSSGERSLLMSVPLQPHVIPESLWHEVYAASIRATEELFEYVRAWAACKGMPSGEFRELPM